MSLARLILRAAAKVATKGGGKAAKAAAKTSSGKAGLATFSRTYSKGAKAGVTETVHKAPGMGPTLSDATGTAAAKVAAPTARVSRKSAAATVKARMKAAGMTSPDRMAAELHEHSLLRSGGFEERLAQMAKMSNEDVKAIAHAFAKGPMPKSRREAIAAITKRRVELKQIDTLSRNAAFQRPWGIGEGEAAAAAARATASPKALRVPKPSKPPMTEFERMGLLDPRRAEAKRTAKSLKVEIAARARAAGRTPFEQTQMELYAALDRRAFLAERRRTSSARGNPYDRGPNMDATEKHWAESDKLTAHIEALKFTVTEKQRAALDLTADAGGWRISKNAAYAAKVPKARAEAAGTVAPKAPSAKMKATVAARRIR